MHNPITITLSLTAMSYQNNLVIILSLKRCLETLLPDDIDNESMAVSLCGDIVIVNEAGSSHQGHQGELNLRLRDERQGGHTARHD